MSFTHLHLHTEYSLLDGAIRPKELIPYLSELGMKSCAITDHGFMGGIVEFYKECKKGNIKPLIGIEAYTTDNPDDSMEHVRDNMHMVLIAKDNVGLERLLEVSSAAAFHNFYYKPRIYRENLRALGGHVVATTACLAGIFAKRLKYTMNDLGQATAISDPDNILERELKFYRSIFGNDFYLELQGWDDQDHKQSLYNQHLLEFGRKHKVPFVITADAHYMKKEDHRLHEVLMALQLKMTLEDYRQHSEMQYGPYFYVASPEEMFERAKNLGCEEAFLNTDKIAEQCNVEIELGKYKTPEFKIEEAPDYSDFLKWKEQF